MPDNRNLRDGSSEQIDRESIYYSEEELKKIELKRNRKLFGKKKGAKGDGNDLKPKTLGESLKWLGTKIMNFIVGGILGGVGTFIVLKGFAVTTSAFLEVNFPAYWLAMVCIGMGLCTAFLATVGESYRLRRENDYSVNARDIERRQETSDEGLWKMMSEEEKKRKARMEQRRLEAEAEAAEILGQKDAEASHED